MTPTAELWQAFNYTCFAGHSSEHGHYTAAVLQSTGEWVLKNDSSVTAISEEEVMSPDAYFLVYQRES
jgi:ubiquitin C-terminal hydrolase